MSESKRLIRADRYLKLLFGWASPLHTAEAFTELYTHAHLPVYRYIYGLHGGPAEEVDDLTAETFMRAWQARNRFDGNQDAALGWLLQIARRLVIDAYRRQRVRGLHNALDEASLPSPEGSSEEQALLNEQRQILWKLLQALPIEQREMVVLRYMLGWRINAIAGHLGLNENTVSVTIRRALARIRANWPE